MIQKLMFCSLLLLSLCKQQSQSAIANSIDYPFQPTTDQQFFSNKGRIANHSASQLLQILETIEKIEDVPTKITLLNEVSFKYIQLNKIDQANQILAQSLSLTEQIKEPKIRVNLLLPIAEQYAQINQNDKAQDILQQTLEIIQGIDEQLTKGELLIKVALSYQTIGRDDKAQSLINQGREMIAIATQPIPDFPFQETPKDLSVGVFGSVSSFRDTTAFLGVDVNYYKQWSLSDVSTNGFFSVSFDSSRTTNNYRPSMLNTSRFRRHFNKKWSFYSDLFVASNQDLFASKNDDEDLTIIVNGLVGASLNLWRGETPKQFLDVRFGLGGRYEYDFISFEERKNQVDPVIGFQIVGQSIQWGPAKIDQSLGIIPSLRDLSDVVISSTTNVSIPITKKWSYSNNLFIRYKTQQVFDENPNLDLFFTTGVDYKF